MNSELIIIVILTNGDEFYMMYHSDGISITTKVNNEKFIVVSRFSKIAVVIKQKPAAIYEDFERGSGQQHTGPFVTKGNFEGNFSVKMTEAIDDLKGRIESVKVSNTQNVSGMSEATISTQVEIKWNSKEAEAQFNQLQNVYDNKVQEIRDNNKLPPAPGPGASQVDLQQWVNKSQEIIQGTNAAIALLGPSPAQQIFNSTQNSKEFEMIKTKRETMPTISQGRGN